MIPEFVRELGYAQDDWIEERDALFDRYHVQLLNHNAKVWFTNNMLIRSAISKLEQDIRVSLSTDTKPPKANFRVLVKLTGLTNTTLCNPLRVYWVEAEVERLQRLSKKKVNKDSKVRKLVSENESLKLSDEKLRFQMLEIISTNRGLLMEIQRLKKINSLLENKLSEGRMGHLEVL